MSPVQMRLGFSTSVPTFALHLSLSGVMVLADASGVTDEIAVSCLSSYGVDVARRNNQLSFPASSLTAVAALPPEVTVDVDETLAGLWEIVQHPSAAGAPVVVEMDSPASLHMRWFDGSVEHRQDLHSAASAALLTLDIPFVAGHDAFEYLRQSCNLPVLAGRAQVNLDGFIEISTSKPQLAESAPIPGMFRINATTLGVPLSYAEHVSRAPGFTWVGPAPRPESAHFADVGVPLSQHASSELAAIAYELAATRARVVAWGPGMGRRFFALAAAVALEATPVLVVCKPQGLWPWARHAQLLGMHSSSSHSSAVTLVTYDMLAADFTHPAGCVIFDGLQAALAQTPALVAAARRVAAASDAFRIDVEAQWSSSPALALPVMSVVRPAEFDLELPVAARYPGDPRSRFAEHVACYVSARPPGAGSTAQFKRSSTITVQPSQDLRTRMEEVAHAATPPEVRITELLEILACGTTHILGPKIAPAAGKARDVTAAGGSVALLTRHIRAAKLLEATLRGVPVHVYPARTGQHITPTPGAVSIVLFERELPSLLEFDAVVAIDYPWSTAALDDAVGSAQLDTGVRDVSVVHLEGSLDDRLALMAARRREQRAMPSHHQPPSPRELAWLLQR